jgi:hypothetical protein
MAYGELTLPPAWTGVNKKTGRYLKGHVPANKGKKWSEWMSKRGAKRSTKGWVNFDKYRCKGHPNAGRKKKPVIAVMDDGRWVMFPCLGAAAEWCGGRGENIGRCCRSNQSRKVLRKSAGHKPGHVNTDHRYMGIRFYFESDNVWTKKIKQ